MLPNPLDDAAVVAAFPEFAVDPSPLGVGGMKNAYHGTRDGQELVLKVVRDPVQTEEQAEELEGVTSIPERLRREIEGMRAIDHPRIVRILDGPDVRTIDGQLRVWYTEPYYSGGTLDDRLGPPHPEADVIDLVMQLLEAVEVLESRGIVHRDIKPRNIVFDESDLPVLLDLGIALFVDLTPLTDQFGRSPRTDLYAAPEQFDMRRNVRFDSRTDLFLVGIVAFQMLTGRHPFMPEDPDGYLQRLANGGFDASALEAVEPSAATATLLKRLLAPNRAHRFRKVAQATAAARACQ